MKKLPILLILFFCYHKLIAQLPPQEFAEIEFLPFVDASMMAKSHKSLTFNIFLNDQPISSIKGNEKLIFKIYSKGRINVKIDINSGIRNAVINISEPKKYYFLVGFLNNKLYDQITEGEALRIKSKWEYEATIEKEEDWNNPIIPSNNVLSKNVQSQGTGFQITSEGYVITNFHVIDGAKSITAKGVYGDFKNPVELSVIAIDRQLDLALLKLELNPTNLESPPFRLVSSSTCKPASEIFTIGFPMKTLLGEEAKVTTGIINSTKGFKGSISEFQISAGIQPGNSGGPLFDKRGNIIGVVNAKVSGEKIDNIGYAIKSDHLLFFLEQVGEITLNQEKETEIQQELSEQVAKFSKFVFIIEAE